MAKCLWCGSSEDSVQELESTSAIHKNRLLKKKQLREQRNITNAAIELGHERAKLEVGNYTSRDQLLQGDLTHLIGRTMGIHRDEETARDAGNIKRPRQVKHTSTRPLYTRHLFVFARSNNHSPNHIPVPPLIPRKQPNIQTESDRARKRLRSFLGAPSGN